MSIAFSLDVKLNANVSISCMEVIDLLINNDWNLLKNNEITYLPLHDDDMFNWTTSNKSVDDFEKLVREKESANEIVGVELTWLNSKVSTLLLMHSGNEFSFSLNINTKYLQTNTEIPDFVWYYKRIICVLKQKYNIQAYSFEVVY